MRTFEDIYKDYCNWLYRKLNDESVLYKNMVELYGEQQTKVFLHKELLTKCYQKNDGVFYFVKFIIGDLEELGLPKPFRYNNLLHEWTKIVQNNKRVCVEAARGHGKSMFFSQIYTIYQMFLYKFRRILLISSNQPQASRILSEIKNIIESNEWLITKKNRERWSTESIGYNKGYILAIGVGSEILGEHVDYVVCDDILRSDNKLSNQQIEDYVFLTLMPMLLNREGTMVLVGTPKNAEDIFSVIEQRNRIARDDGEPLPWFFKKYPAILDEDSKQMLCPDRFTYEQLMAKKREMGSQEFSREYMLLFYSREQSLFPSNIIKPALSRGKSYTLEYKGSKLSDNMTYFISVDVARSGAASADYTVAIVWLYNMNTNDRRLLYMWRKRGLKMSTQSSIIADLSRRFNNCPVVVEKNNIGEDMIEQLIDDYNVNVEEFVTSSASKYDIIRFLIQSFEQEKIIIPQGDEESRKMFKPLIEELYHFCVTFTPAGNEKYEGIGSKDDTVMSLAIGNKGTQLVGVPFALSDFGGNERKSSGKETELFRMIKEGWLE